jgi:hypothetical protein
MRWSIVSNNFNKKKWQGLQWQASPKNNEGKIKKELLALLCRTLLSDIVVFSEFRLDFFVRWLPNYRPPFFIVSL